MTLAGRRSSTNDNERRSSVTDGNNKPGPPLNEMSILAQAGQFDIEAVCTFSYIGKGLTQITCLNACINLVELNLSDNLLTCIEGLEGLSKLKKLTLTSNKIKEVENLESLESLEHLLLQNNQIATFDQLNLPMLGFLPKLRSLYLKNVDGSQPNPVCREAQYRKKILSFFPELRNLDGERLRSVASAAYHNASKTTGHGVDGEEGEGSMFGTGGSWLGPGFWDLDTARDISFGAQIENFKELMEQCRGLNNTAKGLLGRFASMPQSNLSL
mmetsp:Transcript_31987/g.38701  ORF Transcript_31987/g.38701 Transcript_31987/m.38701 type:complete len:271 (+) Transcript_31987:330-1142(+)|eukprot:CAMPEP_0197856344 /NCGR_PEP_ID=MMETSP1438-20131217/28386_1 /TAXON_ID=1461541 /ORGANISM="Pterosperma sp., Strain CCMP1384" /LENGTH=270 /DNA_ID=CAMNT_0043471767 /DNA_START=328 /DNA_END=1140 /DNA_ORIENTATION=-